MDFSKKEGIVKLSVIANATLLTFVAGLLVFFVYFKVHTMVYLSIPYIAIYTLLFVVIYKGHLDHYVWMVYTLLIVYMSLATVSLGYSYGFHLYCMSIIPIVYYCEYIAYKIGGRSLKADIVSGIIVLLYVVSNIYTVVNGPIYTISGKVAGIFLACNSISVFGFLITYTKIILKLVIQSDEKLSNMALVDRLTGLYNRHYMMEHLENLGAQFDNKSWVAIVDIDDFKKINDTYGHNCGDYVLVKLSDIMKEVCETCTISRWGGEEFLITDGTGECETDVLQKLKSTVADTKFIYVDKTIPVTVTVGVAEYIKDQSMDAWIQRADEKLYVGKNSGKNQVVK